MYLIKAEMDRNLPEVRAALTDCQKMHQLITKLFDTDRKSSQILYRINLVQNKLNIYMYANKPANNNHRYYIQQKDISSWLDDMTAGKTLGFDIIASPSKKIKIGDKKNSRRRLLQEPAERQTWLERKAKMHGFEILHAEEQENVHTTGRHAIDNGGTMDHDAYHYQGMLRITDANAFRKALREGIGPGKAYGFGMMMVRIA